MGWSTTTPCDRARFAKWPRRKAKAKRKSKHKRTKSNALRELYQIECDIKKTQTSPALRFKTHRESTERTREKLKRKPERKPERKLERKSERTYFPFKSQLISFFMNF